MTKLSLTKLAVIGALMVALGAFAFSTSTKATEAAGPPGFITVQASSAGCGAAVTAVAFVRDVQGLPAVGVAVSFTSSGGGVGAGVTNGAGVATVVLTMPATYNGVVSVTAQAGGIVGSANTGVNCAPNVCGVNYYGCVAPIAPVNCAVYTPGYPYGSAYGYPYGYNNCAPRVVNTCYAYNCASPCGYAGCFTGYSYSQVAAKINLSVSAGSLNCGGAATVSANVTDAFGVPVVNGTSVSFSTSIGTITPSAASGGGNASATLSTSAGTGGVALITVKAGNAAASTTIQVNCAQPVVTQNVVVYTPGAGQTAPQVIYRPGPPAQPQRPNVVIQRPNYAPPFAPPRTGDAGLLNELYANDDAANAALIDSYMNGQDLVTDESVMDSTDSAIIDSDVDVDASMSNATDESIVLDFDASLIDGNLLGDTDANASIAIANVIEQGSTDFGLS